MKKIILKIIVATTILFANNLFAQKEAIKICDSLKLDTLESDFISELNSTNLFYFFGDALLQDNLIFLKPSNKVKKTEELYKSDTVFIYTCKSEDFKCNQIFRKCCKFSSITELMDAFRGVSLKKDKKKDFKNSQAKSKDGVKFLNFHSRLVVVDLGWKELFIPRIYSNNCEADTNYKNYCKEEFHHVFLILDVLAFQYKKPKKSEVFSN